MLRVTWNWQLHKKFTRQPPHSCIKPGRHIHGYTRLCFNTRQFGHVDLGGLDFFWKEKAVTVFSKSKGATTLILIWFNENKALLIKGFNVEKKMLFHISASQKVPFRKLWQSKIQLLSFMIFPFCFLVPLYFPLFLFVCFFFPLRITVLLIPVDDLTPPE